MVPFKQSNALLSRTGPGQNREAIAAFSFVSRGATPSMLA
jgi:hypothetical protein